MKIAPRIFALKEGAEELLTIIARNEYLWTMPAEVRHDNDRFPRKFFNLIRIFYRKK